MCYYVLFSFLQCTLCTIYIIIIIKKRTIEPHTADHEIVSHKTKSTDAATLLANAVSAKIEDGNIRIICSEDTPALIMRQTAAKWSAEHTEPGHGLLRGPWRCTVPLLLCNWRTAWQTLHSPLDLWAFCESGHFWDWDILRQKHLEWPLHQTAQWRVGLLSGQPGRSAVG